MKVKVPLCLLAAVTMVFAGFGPAPARGADLSSTSAASIQASTAERSAAALVKRMTLEEKLGQLENSAPAIPRLGIPAYQWWTEALHGVVSDHASTDFPEPIGLAATFDTKLVHEDAAAISAETRAIHALTVAEGKSGELFSGAGLDVWAPNINICRDPRWGRCQETYGEDPFLTGRMAVAFIQGIQGPDPSRPEVIATPKHFAVYSGPEPARHSMNITVSAHDLEDTYLPAFRAAIVQGNAGSIMCAYTSVNGQPACANDFLLRKTLRGKWGFKGYVVSDCGALRDIANGHKYEPSIPAAIAVAFRTGVDNECTVNFGGDADKPYAEAVAQGLLTPEVIDRALIRLFTARIEVGDITPEGHAIVPTSLPPVVTAAHRALALRSAEESIVLLKNDGVLPWRTPPRKIVVTGPLVNSIRVLRGNYSAVQTPGPGGPVSVLAGLKAQFPRTDIVRVPVGPSYTDGEPIPESALFTADGRPGVKAEFFKLEVSGAATPMQALMRRGGPAYDARPFHTAVVRYPGAGIPPCTLCKAVYTGVLVPSRSGTYRIGVQGIGDKLTFNGRTLPQPKRYPPSPLPTLETVRLEQGHHYPFRFEMMALPMVGSALVWQPIVNDPAAALRQAAQGADAIVAVVGLTSDLESEEAPIHLPGFSGGDRTSLALPEDQQTLLAAAKATGKKLIVVVMSGSALNLSWVKRNADAIIQAWYPGQAGGTAIARVLAGAVDPAGRLPVTFYASAADLPPFADYSMRGRTYRYYTGTPVYPFGYGLSYTTFAYAPLEVRRDGPEDNGVTVIATVKNTGRRAGDAVAELYLRFPQAPGVPRIALRGFQRVRLAPGKSRKVVFHLTPRNLSSVSEQGERRVLPGRYLVSVGGGQPGTGVPVATTTFKLSHRLEVAE